jgi:hypothetical protein
MNAAIVWNFDSGISCEQVIQLLLHDKKNNFADLQIIEQIGISRSSQPFLPDLVVVPDRYVSLESHLVCMCL